MRTWLVVGAATLAIAGSTVAGEAKGGRGGGSGLVGVGGYMTSRGTYVAPHLRTRPDGILSNNLSYRPSAGSRARSLTIGGAAGGVAAGGLMTGPAEGMVIQSASTSEGFPDAERASRSALYECPPGQRLAWNVEIDDGFCILN